MFDSSQKYRWNNESMREYAIKESKKERVYAIALEMKKDGIPNEQIARITRLSLNEIEKL